MTGGREEWRASWSGEQGGWLSLWPWQWVVDLKWRNILLVIGRMVLGMTVSLRMMSEGDRDEAYAACIEGLRECDVANSRSLGNSRARETGGEFVELCGYAFILWEMLTFLNLDFPIFPGKTEATIKNFSPYYSRQYSVAFCNHVRSEVEQQRDFTSQLLKTKVTLRHLAYKFLPLKRKS